MKRTSWSFLLHSLVGFGSANFVDTGRGTIRLRCLVWGRRAIDDL